MTRFRSRQASVIHGRTPASSSSEAYSVGGKSGRFWCSPTRTASQQGASAAATDASDETEYGTELKSARIRGTARSGTGGIGSAHSTGTSKTQGYGTTSQ